MTDQDTAAAVDDAAASSGPTDVLGGALDPVAGIERRPLAEHAERYTQVHQALQDALSRIDESA
jgi:hypothetical protein